MTSPTVLSHRVIYLRPRAARVPPASTALLAFAELPIYVSNGIRTVSDLTQCARRTVSDSPIALQHNRARTVSDIAEATVGESAEGRGSTCPWPADALSMLASRQAAKCLMAYW